MSRTISNTVEFFPHFAKHGKTIFILKSRYNNDGYAFWFQLLELLCITENHYYDCRTPTAWQYLLSFCGSNEIYGTEILNLLAELGNIDKDLWKSRLIWCPALVENLEHVYNKRNRSLPTKPIIDNTNPIPVTNNPFSGTEMPHSRVEESIVKESKVEDTGGSLKEIFCSFKNEQRYSTIDFDNEFKKFCEYWVDGKRKIKNKKLASHNWLDKCLEYANRNNGGGYGKDKGHSAIKGTKLPDRETGYTEPPPNPRLIAAVAEENNRGSIGGSQCESETHV